MTRFTLRLLQCIAVAGMTAIGYHYWSLPLHLFLLRMLPNPFGPSPNLSGVTYRDHTYLAGFRDGLTEALGVTAGTVGGLLLGLALARLLRSTLARRVARPILQTRTGAA